MPAQYITLISADPLVQKRECGPFSKVRFVGDGRLYVNDDSVQAAHSDTLYGEWIVDNGEALGDSSLTGQVFDIIWGQAKLS